MDRVHTTLGPWVMDQHLTPRGPPPHQLAGCWRRRLPTTRRRIRELPRSSTGARHTTSTEHQGGRLTPAHPRVRPSRTSDQHRSSSSSPEVPGHGGARRRTTSRRLHSQTTTPKASLCWRKSNGTRPQPEGRPVSPAARKTVAERGKTLNQGETDSKLIGNPRMSSSRERRCSSASQ